MGAILTIALLVVAVKGLRSIKLTQQSLGLAQLDMVNRATRESRACAIQRCGELADKIIPANFSVLTDFSGLKVPVFVQDPSKVSFSDANEAAARASAAMWTRPIEQRPELYAKCVFLLNDLERWAMYFTKGLADADTAAKPCAPVFNGIVIQLYPLLVTLRADPEAGEFPNLVELFEVWYGERIRAQNAAEAQALLARVTHLQTKEYKTLPEPIGTKIV